MQEILVSDSRTEEARIARRALFRTILNISVVLIDMVPFVGEIASWIADILKLTKFSHSSLKNLDLTPDVSIKTAWLTEFLEIVSFVGIPMPSHIVETILQLRHDIPRMRKGFNL